MHFQELLLASASLSAATEWAMHGCHEETTRRDCKCAWHQTVDEEVDLNKFLYLQAVINETIRLHPPVSFAAGLAEAADFQVQGTSTLICEHLGICRDGEVIWDEPEKFMPERFSKRYQ